MIETFLKIAIIDTATTSMSKLQRIFDCTEDSTLLSQKATHFDTIIDFNESNHLIDLYKVQSVENGKINPKFIIQGLQLISQSKYDIILIPLSLTLISDAYFDWIHQIEVILSQLTQNKTTIFAAIQNIEFLNSFPANLPYVNPVYPKRDSSSIETIKILNIII